MVSLMVLPTVAQANPPPIPLECRIAQGAWQPCSMEVREVGRHWLVVVGRRRFAFRHDGTGTVHIERNGTWEVVTPRWAEDQSLCWDNLCVRGEFPLD